MSQTALAQMTAELEKLEQEKKTLETSIPVSESCNEYVKIALLKC
jgi:hypothetical protein